MADTSLLDLIQDETPEERERIKQVLAMHAQATGALDNIQVPVPPKPATTDPEALRQAKMLALARFGFGLAGKEPVGKAMGAGVGVYTGLENQERRDMALRMQQAKDQYAMQGKYTDDLRRAAFIKALPVEQLRAYGVPDPLIMAIKAAEKPEQMVAALEQLKPYTLSRGQGRFNPAGGMQSQLPDEQGRYLTTDAAGGITGQGIIPGALENIGNIEYTSESAKRKAEAERKVMDVGQPGGGTAPMSVEEFLQLRRGEQEQAAGRAPQTPVNAQLAVLQYHLAQEKAAGNAANVAAIEQSIAKLQGQQAAPPVAPVAGPPKRPVGYVAPKPPENFQWVPGKEGSELTRLPGSSVDTRVEDIARLEGTISRADIVTKNIDRALEKVGVTTTGLLAPVTLALGGTEATDLSKQIKLIKSNIAWKELQAMREASPTGGALGQVAIQELDQLQSSIAALDQDQSPSQLRQHLQDIKEHYAKFKEEARKHSAAKARRVGGGGYGGSGGWEAPSGWGIEQVPN